MRKLEVSKFVVTPTNEKVNRYSLTYNNGLSMYVISYGGIVQSLRAPERNGKFEDIVLGFDNRNDYLHHEVFTIEPGVQFYTGNFLDGSRTEKDNFNCCQQAGFCLETQHFPDAPNQSHFAAVLLHSGEVFKSVTEYKISVQ